MRGLMGVRTVVACTGVDTLMVERTPGLAKVYKLVALVSMYTV